MAFPKYRRYSQFTPTEVQVIRKWSFEKWETYAYVGKGYNACELIAVRICKHNCKCKEHRPPKYAHKIKPKLPNPIRPHQAALIVAKGICPYQSPYNKGRERLEVSHICGRFQCWNPLHVTMESHSKNLIRKEHHKWMTENKQTYTDLCAKAQCSPPCLKNFGFTFV